VPEVLYLRPLDLRIHAGLLQGIRLVDAEVRGKRLQGVGPDPLLLRGAYRAEAYLVDRAVGPRQRLDLGDRDTVLVPIRGEVFLPDSGWPSGVITVKDSSSA
jgi:hypothetical protein